MKIKVAEKSLSDVLAIKPPKPPKPCRQSALLRKIMAVAAGFELPFHAAAACGKTYELTETGKLAAAEGPTEHEFVSDWYAWQRSCVAQELQEGAYEYRRDVDAYALVAKVRLATEELFKMA